MIVIFLKFVISGRGSHCGYLPQAPKIPSYVAQQLYELYIAPVIIRVT
jgi:hypothetical protein